MPTKATFPVSALSTSAASPLAQCAAVVMALAQDKVDLEGLVGRVGYLPDDLVSLVEARMKFMDQAEATQLSAAMAEARLSRTLPQAKAGESKIRF